MKSVRFITPARREFLSAVAYYNGKELGLGARFAAAVEEATMRALAFPLTGSPASQNTRRVFIKDFPFALIYRPHFDGIVIFAVAHHSQNDRVWKLEVDRRSHQQSSGRSRSAASASSQGAMPS